MGFIYSEFDTTAANFATDCRTKILTSSDYSNPAGTVVKATTPLGATIAVDLAGAAASTQTINTYAYRLWTGGAGTGVDVVTGRITVFKRAAGGTTANVLHVRVAAGPTLLYIDIEGPRAAEANTDSATYGSQRQVFCVAQLTPYMAGDTIPAVVLMGSTSYVVGTAVLAGANAALCQVSRDQINVNSWVQARPFALATPSQQNTYAWNMVPIASDGSVYLSPYVVFEDVAGMRGRLTDVFFAGWYNNVALVGNDVTPGFQPGDQLSYSGNTYRILNPYKSDGTGNGHVGGSFGAAYNFSAGGNSCSPLVAVRVA